jgi:hypothetical protein
MLEATIMIINAQCNDCRMTDVVDSDESAVAAFVAKNPNGAALATLPDIARLLHA